MVQENEKISLQNEKLRFSRQNQSELIESLTAEVESLKEQFLELGELYQSLTLAKQHLQQQYDQLQLELNKTKASLTLAEHEKELLIKMHVAEIERVNLLVASIGYAYPNHDQQASDVK